MSPKGPPHSRGLPAPRSSHSPRQPQRRPRWLADLAVVLVLLLGTGNFVAGFALDDYKPDPMLSGLFVAVVGPLLGIRIVKDGGGT